MPRRLWPDRIRQSPRPSREIAARSGSPNRRAICAHRLERFDAPGRRRLPSRLPSARRDQEVALDDGRLPDLLEEPAGSGEPAAGLGDLAVLARWPKPSQKAAVAAATRSPLVERGAGTRARRPPAARAVGRACGRRSPGARGPRSRATPRPSGRRAGRTPPTSAAAGRPRGRGRCPRSSFARHSRAPRPTLPRSEGRRRDRLQPAAPAEDERRARRASAAISATIDPERERLVLAGDRHVHPVDARDERQRQEDDAGRGQDPERVVQAVATGPTRSSTRAPRRPPCSSRACPRSARPRRRCRRSRSRALRPGSAASSARGRGARRAGAGRSCRKLMISCFAFEMSRTISHERPSKMSSSSRSSLLPILRSIGNAASTFVSTIL